MRLMPCDDMLLRHATFCRHFRCRFRAYDATLLFRAALLPHKHTPTDAAAADHVCFFCLRALSRRAARYLFFDVMVTDVDDCY